MSEHINVPIIETKPNSYKSKTEGEQTTQEKRVEKVISGKATTKKKKDIHKLADVFISEDVSNVKNYILMDVLVPAIKKAVSDIVRDGIDMILYGSPGRSKSGNSTYVSYDKQYSSRRDSRSYEPSRARTRYSFDEVILETRGEAEEVLTRMDELIETYDMVTVADMYDLVGISCDFTDNNYGWTNIRNAKVVRTRDGRYMIEMPKALPIK